MGFSGAKPYGEIIPVARHTLGPQEGMGLSVYVDRECACCHRSRGRGGHRTGPDLSNMTRKGRKAAHPVGYFRFPQAVDSSSIMPQYDLPEEARTALAAFVVSPDFSRYDMNILQRDQTPKDAGPPEEGTPR